MILRQYQCEAETFLFNSIMAGQRDLLLESPVGSGKTSEVKALAADVLEHGYRLVVICVPQNLLKEQWAAAGEWSIGNRTVRLGVGRIVERVAELTPKFWRTERGLAIVTRQALTRIGTTLAGLGPKALAGVLVVADEGHHCADGNASGKALAAMRAKGATTLLVSATPWSSSGDIGGPETVAHRLSAASYVCAFEPGDPSRPPSEWVVERAFVGAPVDDAEETIDRSGSGPAAKRSAAPNGSESARAREVCEAIADRWTRDGFPRVVINVLRQFWREPLLKALREAWRKAGRAGSPNVLDLVGDMTAGELEAAQARLRADSAASRWADIKLDAVISCARMDEGTDWVPCSHVYNAGIPRVAGLILQRWGRASRPKGKIKGYPAKWRDKQTLVFFTPPVSAAGVEGAWQAHRESSWLLAGFLADYRHAKEWTEDRVRRGLSAELPVPASSPTVAKLQGKLAAEVERRGGEMPEPEARAWLAKQGATPADIDATVRRMQMADERHRKAEEKREAALLAGTGLEVKRERRPEAEPLIEEFTTPIVSREHAAVALRFTAMDAGQVAEQMRATSVRWAQSVGEVLAAARAAEERLGRSLTHDDRDMTIAELGGRTLKAVQSWYRRQAGQPLFKALHGRLSPDERVAEVMAEVSRTGRRPAAGTKAYSMMKTLLADHPDKLNESMLPPPCNRERRSETWGRRQFSTLGVLVAEVATAWIADGRPKNGQRRRIADFERVLSLNTTLQEAAGGEYARGLGKAVDLLQVRGVRALCDEIAADCWRLWLDGADLPDPRPWADILAAGDNKRVVKAERVAFLDWTDLDKNGKPKRKPWKPPTDRTPPHDAATPAKISRPKAGNRAPKAQKNEEKTCTKT